MGTGQIKTPQTSHFLKLILSILLGGRGINLPLLISRVVKMLILIILFSVLLLLLKNEVLEALLQPFLKLSFPKLT